MLIVEIYNSRNNRRVAGWCISFQRHFLSCCAWASDCLIKSLRIWSLVSCIFLCLSIKKTLPNLFQLFTWRQCYLPSIFRWKSYIKVEFLCILPDVDLTWSFIKSSPCVLSLPVGTDIEICTVNLCSFCSVFITKTYIFITQWTAYSLWMSASNCWQNYVFRYRSEYLKEIKEYYLFMFVFVLFSYRNSVILPVQKLIKVMLYYI